MAELPPGLANRPKRVQAEVVDDDAPFGPGERHPTLMQIAGGMRRGGANKAEILHALHDVNKRANPPKPGDEIADIAGYLVSKPPGPVDYDLTELGNARRLVDRYGDDLRFAPGQKWLAWDGRRWRPGAEGNVVRKAKEVVRRLKVEAVGLESKTMALELFAWAMKSQSRYVIDAMVRLAWSEPEIELELDDLDADPWVLNAKNGTLNLRTGELREHRREDHLSKIVAVDYDPDARSERWERFLDDTTGGDPELRNYLQKAAGYSLTGDTSEEVLFFVYGPAASGKSTYMSAIKNTLGDYAKTADFESFLSRRFGGGIRNDVARLAGARLVSSIEVDEGKQLAEGLIKELTGGDAVSARFLYREFFEFTPAFKLWLVANHRPRVRDDDEAIWRRIRVIPFANAVPREKRDPELKRELTNASRSGAAILAWAVQGCVRWQREELGIPPAVEQATDSYRADMNLSVRFWEEACELRPDRRASTSALRKSYKAWCGDNDIAPHLRLDDKAFAERLKALGCKEYRTNRTRGWDGIGVRKPADDGPTLDGDAW